MQYELLGIVGRPLQLIRIRDHLDPDWHTQEFQPPLLVVLGPLANIICNLQEDGIIPTFWSDHHQATLWVPTGKSAMLNAIPMALL
ncbi:MAG: hypothetical protein ACKPKO_12665, partial [Candidatus Fonsibacter sp.]